MSKTEDFIKAMNFVKKCASDREIDEWEIIEEDGIIKIQLGEERFYDIYLDDTITEIPVPIKWKYSVRGLCIYDGKLTTLKNFPPKLSELTFHGTKIKNFKGDVKKVGDLTLDEIDSLETFDGCPYIVNWIKIEKCPNIKNVDDLNIDKYNYRNIWYIDDDKYKDDGQNFPGAIMTYDHFKKVIEMKNNAKPS